MSASTLEHYAQRFETFATQVAARDPSWLAALRRQGLDRFLETGFPTTKWEDWRYTNPARLAEVAFESAGRQRTPPHRDELERLCAPVYACGLFVCKILRPSDSVGT